MELQCNLYQHLDRQLKSFKHLKLTNIKPWLLFGQVKIFVHTGNLKHKQLIAFLLNGTNPTYVISLIGRIHLTAISKWIELKCFQLSGRLCFRDA